MCARRTLLTTLRLLAFSHGERFFGGFGPSRLQAHLEVPVSPGAAADSAAVTRADPTDGAGESTVGSGADRQRAIGEARNTNLTAYCPEVSPEAASGSPTWRPALIDVPEEPARAIVACDFFVTVTATFRLLYVFVMIEHRSRRLIHCNVTPPSKRRMDAATAVRDHRIRKARYSPGCCCDSARWYRFTWSRADTELQSGRAS